MPRHIRDRQTYRTGDNLAGPALPCLADPHIRRPVSQEAVARIARTRRAHSFIHYVRSEKGGLGERDQSELDDRSAT